MEHCVSRLDDRTTGFVSNGKRNLPGDREREVHRSRREGAPLPGTGRAGRSGGSCLEIPPTGSSLPRQDLCKEGPYRRSEGNSRAGPRRHRPGMCRSPHRRDRHHWIDRPGSRWNRFGLRPFPRHNKVRPGCHNSGRCRRLRLPSSRDQALCRLLDCRSRDLRSRRKHRRRPRKRWRSRCRRQGRLDMEC